MPVRSLRRRTASHGAGAMATLFSTPRVSVAASMRRDAVHRGAKDAVVDCRDVHNICVNVPRWLARRSACAQLAKPYHQMGSRAAGQGYARVHGLPDCHNSICILNSYAYIYSSACILRSMQAYMHYRVHSRQQARIAGIAVGQGNVRCRRLTRLRQAYEA
jgi:hypothetical protein